MSRCISILLIMLFIMCAWQTAFADSARVQYNVNGHEYQRFDNDSTWSSARTFCEGQGAHLATLTSQGENDFVFQNVGVEGQTIWLGGTDENFEGDWEWITGEAWSYTNWDNDQPDNNGIGQNYLTFWESADTPGQWDDDGLPNSDPEWPFICEWETTAVPTMNEWGMVIFIALAGLGSIYYLRRKQIEG